MLADALVPRRFWLSNAQSLWKVCHRIEHVRGLNLGTGEGLAIIDTRQHKGRGCPNLVAHLNVDVQGIANHDALVGLQTRTLHGFG